MIDEQILTKILIIDDDVNMTDILSNFLTELNCEVSTYTEPISAIESLKEEKYDILILNYFLSPINGDKVVELIRKFNKEIYIILMSNHKNLSPTIDIMRNLDIQAIFEKSSHFNELILLVQSGIKYIEQLRNIKSMKIQLEENLLDFAKILINTIDAKDHYSKEHSERVSSISILFSKYLNLKKKDIETLKLSSLFHDIGKIGIPDNILLKTSSLTNEEYDTIKLHPIIGANILSNSNLFNNITPIVLSHHERIDGKGYPNKLKGDEIPYLAKVLSICDCFDAIVSKRPYKEGASIEYAISQLKNGGGTQFDLKLVSEFISFVESNIDEISNIILN